MKLLGRIIVEKRLVLLPIALAIVANMVAYALVVYPLQSRVSSAETRKAEAESNRRSAERQLADARATQASEQKAETDLQTFYRKVLPVGLPEARRAVYVRLAQIARECNVRYDRQSADEVRDQKESNLERLRLTLVLNGTYEDVRRFLHAIETAPEFLIVDTMGLLYRNEANALLVLNLSVSTYFWAGSDET
ncbi:MAG: GspMb/PilO family protein [Bacteroidales bacterium]